MRMLESIGHTAWTTCEECGNDFPAGTYRCGRCGHAPNFLRRVTSFASAALGGKSISRPKRSRGAYPGLAEGALKFYRARRKRSTRIWWAGVLAAGAVGVWAFSGPRFSGMDLEPQAAAPNAFVTGVVMPAQPARAAASNPPLTQPATNAADGRVGEFYRALENRNLTVAHRRLADMLERASAAGQLQQMQAELASREQQRDSLLHRAWHCRAVGDWQCVSDNAAQASAVDASSVSARRLVSQAAQAGRNR
ncbi:hypothetical protein [Caballeronia sp. DA-9]|uniref:hypothetical protein n=1 Tax=Caballeronia sp. DA-9 TaxID=3436237 RepID=UPI003F67C6FC